MPRIAACALLLAVVSVGFAADPPKKRPLTYADQDIWGSASGVTLSPDGKYAVFTLSVPNADGLIVLKNVATGGEVKVATGARATPLGGPPTGDDEEEVEDQIVPPTFGGGFTPRGPTGSPTFTPDSKFVYFPLSPTKAELDKARADKKKPEEFPKAVLAVMDVSSGQIVKRLERVRSFSIVGEGAGVLVATMADPVPLSPGGEGLGVRGNRRKRPPHP